MKKIFIVLTVLVAAGIIYVAYGKFQHTRFISSLIPHIKNTSLRVTNSTRYVIDEGSKITFKELFERLESDISEIDKRLIEVQSLASPDTKAITDPVVEYILNSQEYLRAQLSTCRKRFELKNTIESTHGALDKLRISSSNGAYFGKRTAEKVLNDFISAEKKYDQSLPDLAVTVSNLEENRLRLLSIVPEDALIPIGQLNGALQKNSPQPDAEIITASIKDINTISAILRFKADTIGALFHYRFEYVRLSYLNAEANTLKGKMSSLLLQKVLNTGDYFILSNFHNNSGNIIRDKDNRVLGEISKVDLSIQEYMIRAGAATYRDFIDDNNQPHVNEKLKNIAQESNAMPKIYDDIEKEMLNIAKTVGLLIDTTNLNYKTVVEYMSPFLNEWYKKSILLIQVCRDNPNITKLPKFEFKKFDIKEWLFYYTQDNDQVKYVMDQMEKITKDTDKEKLFAMSLLSMNSANKSINRDKAEATFDHFYGKPTED